MIVTDLEHATQQIALTPSLQKAIDFLRQARGRELPDGRVEIDGNTVYALVQSYETAPVSQARLEAHRKYVDVQYVASGEEVIGWVSTDRLTPAVPYDDAKDVWFGSVPLNEMTPVRLAAGQLAVFYPPDAHAPRLAAGVPACVKKIVVKVKVAV